MIIKEKEYKKVLFIHIPKTAGQSVWNFICENNLDDSWVRVAIRKHDSYLKILKNNIVDEDVFSFAVVRNPYNRTYSCFKQYNKTNGINLSFMEYLNNVKDDHISLETPLLPLPQHKYVINESDNVAVTKLYRFENLKELEEDIQYTLPYDNVGEYSEESYNQDYTEEAIKLVQELYEEDFVRFEYSKDFK